MISDESRKALERFLATDSADAGCGETLALLHAYAEVIAAGGDPERSHPGIAAHLRTCHPCAEDLRGLLHVMRTG
jgi:hypothetical protein